MQLAVALMYGGAVATVLSAIVFFATTDQLTEALIEEVGSRSQRLVYDRVDAARQQRILQTLVWVGLWIWMAVKNREGRKWARIVATVFGAINAFGFALGSTFVSDLDSGDVLDYLLPRLIVEAVSVVLAIVILFQLYREASSRFYDETSRYQAAMTLRGYR